MLPTDAKDRKNIPLARGLLDYFPDALCEVAELSRIGNDQHNPGQPLHWAKEKSTDEADALVRHLIDRGTRDKDGVRHSAKVAWRALALLQREIEAEKSQSQDEHGEALQALLCAEPACRSFATGIYSTLDAIAGEYKERWLCDACAIRTRVV